MSKIYESILSGLNEAIEDAQGTQKKLKRDIFTVIPVKNYSSSDIQKIRKTIRCRQPLTFHAGTESPLD